MVAGGTVGSAGFSCPFAVLARPLHGARASSPSEAVAESGSRTVVPVVLRSSPRRSPGWSSQVAGGSSSPRAVARGGDEPEVRQMVGGRSPQVGATRWFAPPSLTGWSGLSRLTIGQSGILCGDRATVSPQGAKCVHRSAQVIHTTQHPGGAPDRDGVCRSARTSEWNVKVLDPTRRPVAQPSATREPDGSAGWVEGNQEGCRTRLRPGLQYQHSPKHKRI
jgi:hypothetical protein